MEKKRKKKEEKERKEKKRKKKKKKKKKEVKEKCCTRASHQSITSHQSNLFPPTIPTLQENVPPRLLQHVGVPG